MISDCKALLIDKNWVYFASFIDKKNENNHSFESKRVLLIIGYALLIDSAKHKWDYVIHQ